MAKGKPTPWLFVLAAWLGIATPAASRDLRLEPVSLALQPGEQATTLWLSNTGQQPLQAQVRLFSWTQEEGGEVLVPTRAVAVSPPLLEVPPLGSNGSASCAWTPTRPPPRPPIAWWSTSCRIPQRRIRPCSVIPFRSSYSRLHRRPGRN